MSSRMALGWYCCGRRAARRAPCASRRTGSRARARGRAGSSRSADRPRSRGCSGRRAADDRGRPRTRPAPAARSAPGGATERRRQAPDGRPLRGAGCGRRGDRLAGDRGRSRRLIHERQRQRECAARAGTAHDGDVAAEQARQIARDRQAESRAAVLAMRAAVRLAERLEDDRPAGARECRRRCRARRTTTPPSAAFETCSDTSPRSVNLIAFDSRFFRICPSRCSSVSICAGTSASTAVDQAQPLLLGHAAAACGRASRW